MKYCTLRQIPGEVEPDLCAEVENHLWLLQLLLLVEHKLLLLRYKLLLLRYKLLLLWYGVGRNNDR